MKVKENLEHILKELQDATFKIEEEQIENVLKLIAPDKKIFLTGKGRSGLAAKGFANRLMHLGFQAYVIGEISTPHTKAGDLLIITSGSGETDALVSIAKKAKESGLYLGLVTIHYLQCTISEKVQFKSKWEGTTVYTKETPHGKL